MQKQLKLNSAFSQIRKCILWKQLNKYGIFTSSFMQKHQKEAYKLIYLKILLVISFIAINEVKSSHQGELFHSHETEHKVSLLRHSFTVMILYLVTATLCFLQSRTILPHFQVTKNLRERLHGDPSFRHH